ncbi:MAG: hypothetical protein KTR35_15925 [Gammaproteobacteria bacterium]|nr:hypothetical protein [Gammaproteobacteria bacterium]
MSGCTGELSVRKTPIKNQPMYRLAAKFTDVQVAIKAIVLMSDASFFNLTNDRDLLIASAFIAVFRK